MKLDPKLTESAKAVTTEELLSVQPIYESPTSRYNIFSRKRIFVFDDPMRRYYNGAFGKHHYEWSRWERLESNVLS